MLENEMYQVEKMPDKNTEKIPKKYLILSKLHTIQNA